ncbi:MAG: GNAT family N-acetyltransferase [Candidatus Competibacteraceae bacterium]|uniref:Nitrilase/cyanide hydratase and apolipoprotein N-acyltransferase n=1 Tax=Candidatus Contendobacter odensis Run_B_J11 TaxID=1400861 RepID=A0A7U7GEU1_9GAMM|nr:bifunctional GNAT family N-acetyltransferase/carbon-nitrogen hydrolase family protein [Candidatus Contendobacter odensis]MBK8537827.1 GNAT family N-acetyltransferase [Candidatus Competibacteraceae bacterium]MBK8750786.1 GNAT family N-acetyltransferase [Candidatus Competibacteraceae bacterium]CDH46785.1 Nitrilase/cyanide hydratase and apolipoprotein N-acyltransferase [Candidatus Contendobacter odensis Run_B_J11]
MAEKTPEHPVQHRLKLRNLRLSDYGDVQEIMELVYPNMDGAWTREQFASQIARFPEGQICIEDNDKVVAAAISLIVEYSRYGDRHTYWQIIGDGYLTTHDPNGDTLYGVDVFVHPDYRDMRLGRRLYDARKELCEKLNLRAIVVGGRIPGYGQCAHDLTPQQYVERVRAKEQVDPILTFQLANDFHVRKIITGYLPDDDESRAYAVLLEWLNIYYEDKEVLIGGRKSVVRVGAVQWQMRQTASLEEMLQQVEYFVDAVAGYKTDIVLFPEFFNGPLMAQFNQRNTAEAVRQLAEFTDPLREAIVQLAVAYNVNIIAGSMPEYSDGALYNAAYVCRRDGTWDKQSKLHITPDERSYWGLQGGDALKVFELDIGKIGILICYDVEFPELPRLLADQGMQILFVPFWTDTKNAYLRVRRCAQARAIENECYVVISGSVGNLPKVENMDMQYSQAAVFTPSDFAFPHDAIAAEATPNTEMTLIVDLDLDSLKEMRVHGSVRNFRDRRLDLYKIAWTGRS